MAEEEENATPGAASQPRTDAGHHANQVEFQDRRNDIPPPPIHGGRNSGYPWPSMAIGESVWFPGQNGDGKAAASARHHARAHGKRFIARKEGEGVRIWRVN